MVNKKINPKFFEVAKRQRTEGFLEAEARKVEEFKKLKEDERRKAIEEIANRRRQKIENLRLDEKRKRDLKDYIEGLNGFDGDDMEISVYAFVNHPDFPIIYNQLDTIPSVGDKWGFLLRRAYEIGRDIDFHIGFTLHHNPAKTKKRLEDYGIYLLCPYLEDTDRELHPKNDCSIDDEPVMTMCDGLYEQCDFFKDRAQKSAVGLAKLPEIKREEPKFKIPKIEVDPVDLRDLSDWWKMEGKYE